MGFCIFIFLVFLLVAFNADTGLIVFSLLALSGLFCWSLIFLIGRYISHRKGRDENKKDHSIKANARDPLGPSSHSLWL